MNITRQLHMQYGKQVTFKYNNNLIVGVINEKKGVNYVVDVASVNGIKSEFKTVILVNASTVIRYMLNKE